MHNNQAPYVTVSRVSVNKSVTLVEDVQVGKVTLGIQYDTGCQLSIISKSALSNLPPSMYFLGTSSQIRVMTYAGEGKTLLTTAVKLRLPGKTLKLSTIEENLNNSPGFSFSIPLKWRSFTGTSTSHHTVRISILLGGDHHLFFPTEIELNSQGMALYQSNLTQNYMVYGSVPSSNITWVEQAISYSNRIRRRTRQSGRNRRRTRKFIKKPEGEPDTPNNLEPPTKPNLSTNPAPPLKPVLPIVPDPPNNLKPPTKTDPSDNPASPPNPEPPIDPALPTNPEPTTGLNLPPNPASPLNQLYPFSDMEKQQPQETIHGLAEDLASEQQTKHYSAQD